MNRLTSASGNTHTYSYGYDRYGNRWQSNTTSSNPGFDVNTNRVLTYSYDAAGNVLSDSLHSYTYDAEGNVLKVDGGSAGTYGYDALNNRVSVQGANGSYGYLFDYAGKRISGWLQPSDFGNQGRIYWDGMQIAYRAWDGSTYFDHKDWIGTERMRTDHAGSISSTYVSLPFGEGYTPNENNPTGNALDNQHFALLDHDTESGTEHAQFRQYSPNVGRWLSPDPYGGSYDGSDPQSFNRYSYVGNVPLTFADPIGWKPGDPLPPENGVPTIEGAGLTGCGFSCFGWGFGGGGVHLEPFQRLDDEGGGGGSYGAPNNAKQLLSHTACTAAATAAGASGGALLGGGIGGVVGGAAGAGGGTLVAPGVGTIGGGVVGAEAGAGTGAWIGGFVGGAIGNIVGNVLCSKGGGPSFGGNQRENKQANDAKNEAERITGKRFTPAQERIFHDEITGQNYGYHELVQIAVDVLEGRI
jgi:RHS repeat-associated protein